MPYSDYRPELMGSAVLEPAGAFEAGSLQSLMLTYTAGEFGIGGGHVDPVGFGVERDGVAVLDERDWTASLRFRSDVADDKAVRAAGESAVGD